MKLPMEERAGGIVFQKTVEEIKYLLVTSNSNQDRWIFPAGHVEKGESPETAALREVTEEAGIEAKIITDLGNFQYFWYRDRTKIIINTKLFLMEFLQSVTVNPEGRQVKFFLFDDILVLNIWKESRIFLKKAQKKLNSIKYS